MRSRWLRLALEVALVVGVVVAVSAFRERHLLPSDTAAPAFELTSLDGRRVALSDFRGKRVLVHFWATWCGVCRMEFGALAAVHRGLEADEALVTVVADSEDPDHVRRFVRDHGITYPVLLGEREALRAFRIEAFPTNYFIDASGQRRRPNGGDVISPRHVDAPRPVRQSLMKLRFVWRAFLVCAHTKPPRATC